jgi:bifunctional non-homologous end joining protein LigD
MWAYEIKHDGLRFVCWRELDRVRTFSRRGNDWTDRVPRIAEVLRKAGNGFRLNEPIYCQGAGPP